MKVSCPVPSFEGIYVANIGVTLEAVKDLSYDDPPQESTVYPSCEPWPLDIPITQLTVLGCALTDDEAEASSSHYTSAQYDTTYATTSYDTVQYATSYASAQYGGAEYDPTQYEDQYYSGYQ